MRLPCTAGRVDVHGPAPTDFLAAVTKGAGVTEKSSRKSFSSTYRASRTTAA